MLCPLLPLPFLFTRGGGNANGPASIGWPAERMPGVQLGSLCAGVLGGI
jgi:hypothetical protein